MTRYLISFDAHAMDHIPEEDMPEVSKTSHAVVQDAADAGVWVFGAGMEGEKAASGRRWDSQRRLVPGSNRRLLNS